MPVIECLEVPSVEFSPHCFFPDTAGTGPFPQDRAHVVFERAAAMIAPRIQSILLSDAKPGEKMRTLAREYADFVYARSDLFSALDRRPVPRSGGAAAEKEETLRGRREERSCRPSRTRVTGEGRDREAVRKPVSSRCDGGPAYR